MWIHAERHASPRPGNRRWQSLAALHWCQAERSRKRFWDAAQSDGHLPSWGNASIASQPLLKRQSIMRPLRTGQRRRWERWSGRKIRFYPHLQALVTKKLHTRPPMLPTAPILPEDGERPDDQWMQQHAHLARLRSGVPLPLALFAQRTRAATTDASRIHYAQAPIGLSAPLMGTKLLTCWTVKRAIRLEDKILPREAARFPGQSDFCRPVPLNRSLRGGLLVCRWERWSKLGGAHRVRMKLMAQLQTEVPDPLADELPCLLTRCCMAGPPVGVLFLVFIS